MVEQTVQQPDGGSNPAPPLQFNLRGSDNLLIREIPLAIAAAFVAQHHYSKVMPKLNKVVMGLFQKDELVGVITFGWGVRPEDTIRCLFPSLDSPDYLEIGKLCLLDSMPKNTESRFITAAMRFLKQIRPNLKLVFTWADALWGKPGYIYQASNFIYGGFIWTEVYMDAEGNRLHPRQLHKKSLASGWFQKDGTKGEWTSKNGVGVCRPSPAMMVKYGLKQIFGMQFRYAYFLCNNLERTKLVMESRDAETYQTRKGEVRKRKPVIWGQPYPKHADMQWKMRDGVTKGPQVIPQPKFAGAFDTEKEKR